MANELQGSKIALLVAPKGTEHVEFAIPKKTIEQAGGTVEVISMEEGTAQTVNHDLELAEVVSVDKVFASTSAENYDGLIIPGGTVGADKLRGSEEAVKFVRAFFEAGKPVAAICHGPWALVEADVVKGKQLTSYPTLQTDIRNAGGEWVDDEVVVDEGLITSRNPNDLPAFCAAIVEEFTKAKRGEQARSLGVA
jgi:protease I